MNTRPIHLFLVTTGLLVAGLLISVAGGPALAQDESETQTFQLDPFDAIDLEGAGEVVIQIGDEPSLELTTDRRVSEFFEASVEDGVLSAGFPATLVFDVAGFSPIRYVITTPSVNEIRLNGPLNATLDGLETGALALDLSTAAELDITGLRADSLTATLDLASTARLQGSVDTQQVEITNASTYDAGELDSASAEMTVSQASTATVRVRESLTGSVSTVSTLEYIGEAPTVDVETSSLGSVEQLPFVALPGASPIAATPVASPVAEAATAAPVEVDVAMTEFRFEPQVVEVAAGGTVTWTNLDNFEHDVAQLPLGSGFASPSIPKDGTYSFTFEEAGTVDYNCPSHPAMTGQIVVVEQ